MEGEIKGILWTATENRPLLRLRSIFQYCFLFKENNGYGRIEIYFFEMVNRSDEEVLWLTITSAYLMS